MKMIEAYIDGTNVKPLENYTFNPNQKVFITIPSSDDEYFLQQDKEHRQNQFKALEQLSTLFDKNEVSAIEESFNAGIKFIN